MSGGAYGWLQRAWYESAPGYQLLAPLTLLYGLVTALRRWLYRVGVLQSVAVRAPVVVVGNIVAGGAGKTPLTLFLANALRERGYSPGIVSRGYGRDSDTLAEVTADSVSRNVGDEPLLLARRSGCPVVVGRDRVAAAEALLEKGVDIIVADDGLQHYRLRRDFEICVVDGERGLGNGWLLPAGPLREPASRLATVDAVVSNGAPTHESLSGVSARTFRLVLGDARPLGGGTGRSLQHFADSRVHAIAGIGNPERFFRALEQSGLDVIRHPLADHAALASDDLDFGDDLPVLMTEKDAVKLDGVAHPGAWFVPAELIFEPGAPIEEAILAVLKDQEEQSE